MQTITTRVTDGVYESIAREAEGRRVSMDEIIYEWLVAGEETNSRPSSPDENEAFWEREEHHTAERRILSEWHESRTKQLRA